MWQNLSNFVMTWLDPIGVVIGLTVTLPVFWTWYEIVLGERRRRRRWFHELREEPGERPAILIVDLLPGRDIQASVEKFRAADPRLASVPADRIFRLQRHKPLKPGDLPALHDQLRQTAARLLATGADRLHYFHAGPAICAALVGAEFSNALPVFLYQHRPEGGYHNYGPLKPQP